MSGAPYGAIEAGGTKFVCAAAYGVGSVVAEARIDTTDPAGTLDAVERFFAGVEAQLGAFRSFGTRASARWMLTLSAERIVFGGGVMRSSGLLPFIRQAALRVLNGYPSVGAGTASIERILVAPDLGERSGLTGAILLAETAS